MTPNPEAVTPDEPVSRAAEIMRDIDVGAIPVIEDRSSMRLVGLITDRDITVRHVAERHREDCTVQSHMTDGQLNVVSPDSDDDDVMSTMKRAQVRRVPVVEDGERLIGIIAQADLAVDEGPEKPEEVEETLERISEPGRPRR